MATSPQPSLQVQVLSPVQVIYNGPAQTVSSVNQRGPFDVLPSHTNFITLIKTQLTLSMEDQSQKQIPLDRGLMRVYQNQVRVFVGL